MKPLILIIMDGFGLAGPKNNAIAAAKTPNLDYIFKNYPTTKLSASGLDVGLPDGQMGNSEVGHTNIGAGRVVYQDLTRISKAIADGTFFENHVIWNAIKHTKLHNSAIHLMGLLSDGGIHSHVEHLYALLKLIKESGLNKVYIHVFLDGRDTSPTSGIGFIKELQNKLEELNIGEISTIYGRYFAMDRDNRWDRTEKVYNALVLAEGAKNKNFLEVIELSYKNNITDEFFNPTVVNEDGIIKDNDSVIFFNFRPDRARQITKSLILKEFDGFKRKKVLNNLKFVSLTEYDKELSNYIDVAFEPVPLTNMLGEYLSNRGFKQLRIAETEKYAHVTFFFNGGIEKKYPGESRILIPSPKVATYDLKPEMSAYEITEKVVAEIDKKVHDVIIMNFANCDMVGHTGIFDAAVQAVETVDSCLKKVVDKILAHGGCAIITADHGNAEKMRDSSGVPFTAHTTNLVPFSIVGYNCKLKEGGKLCDIAPTILEILEQEVPTEMTGESLIQW